MRVSSSYPLTRLRRAIETATTHADPTTRRRAGQKALAWEAVLSGMASGTLDIGSRTPVADTPAWVTLEVVHGGFATGRYVAEGPLDDDERELLDQLPAATAGSTDRMRLNTWFLSDEGLGRLDDALRDGTYVIDVPEQGALPVAAWLIGHGHAALALDLVTEIYPLLHRLRFYPRLAARAPASGALVHRRSVGQVAAELGDVEVPDQVAAMNEALLVWRPLYDRLVALWLRTVSDGWPCATWPADWQDDRRRWLADYERAASDHVRCRDHRRTRSNFAILRAALERCEADSSALSGRDVGRIRMVLRRSIARWGEPGSDSLERLRARQRAWAGRPTHRQLAAALVERLSSLPADAGIPDPDPILQPIPEHGEGGDGDPPAPVPYTLARKVERAREAPIEELVERGVIPSSEVLAEVLPQISSHVASSAFRDPVLRELHARIYAAFRRRRSLLLLNLEHQVRLDELPWVRALGSFRTPTSDTRARARDTLAQTTLLALTSFPHTILPNPLVRELAALARSAGLDIPFVEEVAADIFMGTFTPKWRDAAVLASTVMAGTLYARYYDLPAASAWDSAAAGAFPELCGERAREAGTGDGSFVARNGAVIEQSQILTTHNLAPLVDRLALAGRLAPQATSLAATTIAWIVRQQNARFDTWHAQLRMLKNTAYAWRQAIFFLSFTDRAGQTGALAELRASVERQPADWRRRFRPAVAGLEAVVDGATFDPAGRLGDGGGRRFLGWSVGSHWLLPDRGRG